VKNFWLVKQEPSTYSWSDFVKEGETVWTGVRNFAARNNLRRMHKGDDVLFYHSGGPSSPRRVFDRTGSSATAQEQTKSVVGIAKVTRQAYRDPTGPKEEDWSAVDLAPVRALKRSVALAEIKSTKSLKDIALVRQSRLSVMPLGRKEFETILKMGA
jgi:predicted RNA-binding protein with PUA-like domain